MKEEKKRGLRGPTLRRRSGSRLFISFAIFVATTLSVDSCPETPSPQLDFICPQNKWDRSHEYGQAGEQGRDALVAKPGVHLSPGNPGPNRLRMRPILARAKAEYICKISANDWRYRKENRLTLFESFVEVSVIKINV